MSRRRFFGWEPRTFYIYDNEGRLLYTQPESEWDDESRDWALALLAADDNKCPSCGGPMSECLDPDARYDVGDPVRCQRTTALAAAHKKYYDAIDNSQHSQARALMWSAKLRP